MIVFFFMLFAYIIGSIPVGYIIARLKGIDDITKHGSGNIGATNVARILGPQYFLIIFALDVFKGFFAMLLVKSVTHNQFILLISGLLILLGSIRSIFLKGKGGKGMATGFGILLALNPLLLTLLALIWFAGWYYFGVVGMASAVTAASLPIVVLLTFFYSLPFVLFCCIVSGIVLYRHRDNIRAYYSK